MNVGTPQVLDASALLAYLRNETGAQLVEQALVLSALMSTTNWSEVLSKLVDETGTEVDTILRTLRERGLLGGLLTIHPLTEEDAVAIARLRPLTRQFGLSLAERAALALAMRLGAPILTADRAWQHLSLSVPILLIR